MRISWPFKFSEIYRSVATKLAKSAAAAFGWLVAQSHQRPTAGGLARRLVARSITMRHDVSKIAIFTPSDGAAPAPAAIGDKLFKQLAAPPSPSDEERLARGGRRPLMREQSSLMMRAVEEKVSTTKAVNPLVILPDVWWMGYWDLTTGLALVFTALVTPYEVAMLETSFDGLFVVNRLVDLIFYADIGLAFFSAYRKSAKEGGTLVTNLRTIRWHYLRGWFLIDLSSMIPLDTVGVVQASMAKDDGGGGGGGGGGASPNLKGLRLMKLLKLMKLVRLVKASRMLQKVESQIAIPYDAHTTFLELLLRSVHGGYAPRDVCSTPRNPDTLTHTITPRRHYLATSRDAAMFQSL